ncbi:hypothetical protein [Spiroplasma platyhelix]|uniref:Uncharacterized protein n=1 Tax=Spiroplasma platyhelix PALS-1 TaxID=1276218 RepID=A0A846TWQ1_9MOLU|nr:hypothetical protein [Spiroplasma platyhelix]MBE4704091.1 hypothetical protein [Spiroplasma platyhelix PALS-1]NKE38461.1 hypothetical protein [Spiroplasma platyhelix PALS-1]UJB29349.1 hypothetical protein SPLAT_v1c05850 [Spiroplasma platyhelix PALS-1]
MDINNNNNQKKSDQFLDEVISPMFGHEYQNRVVPGKNEEKKVDDECLTETNYLEKQIEEELEAQTKIDKAKQYQESSKTDTDVLRQYHKQKENEEIKAALPSNYLNFRDNLEKTSDLSTISDFDLSVVEDLNYESSNTNATSTVSEILDEIFDK